MEAKPEKRPRAHVESCRSVVVATEQEPPKWRARVAMDVGHAKEFREATRPEGGSIVDPAEPPKRKPPRRPTCELWLAPWAGAGSRKANDDELASTLNSAQRGRWPTSGFSKATVGRRREIVAVVPVGGRRSGASREET